MPNRPPSFGGIGLGRKTRRAFGTALGAGGSAVEDFLASNKRAAKKIGTADNDQLKRIYEWAHTGVDPFSARGQTAPPPTATSSVTPPLSGPSPTWQEMVEKFLPVNVPGGSSAIFPEYRPDYSIAYKDANRSYAPTGNASSYTAADPREYDVLGNYLTNNLSRLGHAGDLGPEYQRQMDLYSEVSRREADKQAAALSEAYGSRGARYSTDLMTGTADMRRQTAQDLALTGIQAQDRLNQARQAELGLTTGGLQQVGAGRAAISEAGMARGFGAAEAAAGRNFEQDQARDRATENMTEAERRRMFENTQGNAGRAGTAYLDAVNRAWQEYMMGRLPPQVLEAMLGYAATFSPPGSAVTS